MIGRILDLKTGTVKKEGNSNTTLRTHMGCRRAFICRFRIGNNMPQLTQHQHNFNQQQVVFNNYTPRTHIHMNALDANYDAQNYAVVHVTGYTKSWPSNANNNLQLDDSNNENNNKFCLIAIARIQVTNMSNDSIDSSNLEFIIRVNQEGTITFVDQRYFIISLLS